MLGVETASNYQLELDNVDECRVFLSFCFGSCSAGIRFGTSRFPAQSDGRTQMTKKRQPKKASQPTNKAQSIREYKADHPTAMPKAIAEHLNLQGVDCTPQYVSMILSNDRRQGSTAPRRRGRPAGSTKANRAAVSVKSSQLSLNDVMVAKDFVAQLGGVDKAKAAVEVFDQLAR